MRRVCDKAALLLHVSIVVPECEYELGDIMPTVDWSDFAADEGTISSGDSATYGTTTFTVNYSNNGDGSGVDAELTWAQFGGGNALELDGNGADVPGGEPEGTYDVNFNFSEAVENVSFRINDFDVGGFDDFVTITAMGPDGPVTIQITPGAGNSATITGNGTTTVTADAGTIGINPINESGSLLVEIAGPLTDIDITYGNLGAAAQFIHITQVSFDVAPPPCFVRGTKILTDKGERAIEDLQTGDLIVTKDNGLQPIRWIGSRKMPANGKYRPIQFMAGSVGNSRDMFLSPLHKVLIKGWKAELLFGQSEALVTAEHLINGDTIFGAPRDEVEYFHFMFDAHQIVFSDGAETESFYVGEIGLNAFDESTRNEILEVFPELQQDAAPISEMAATVLRKHEASLLN